MTLFTHLNRYRTGGNEPPFYCCRSGFLEEQMDGITVWAIINFGLIFLALIIFGIDTADSKEEWNELMKKIDWFKGGRK